MRKDIEKTWKKVKEMSRQVVKHKARSDGNDQYWTCDISSWSHLSIYLRSWLIFSLLYQVQACKVATAFRKSPTRHPHTACNKHIDCKGRRGTRNEGEEMKRKAWICLNDPECPCDSVRFLRFGTLRRHAKSLRSLKKLIFSVQFSARFSALPLKARNWAARGEVAPCCSRPLRRLLRNKSIDPKCRNCDVGRHACLWLSTQDSRHCFEKKIDDVYLVSWKRVDRWLGFPSSMVCSMTSRSDFWLWFWHPQSFCLSELWLDLIDAEDS